MTVKAFIFDVFGTLTDWRTSISREVKAVFPNIDSDAFADAWRAEYQPAMAAIRSGDRGYVPLDDIHAENLDSTLKAFGINPLEDAQRTHLSRAWERLDPWPDVLAGLVALKEKGLIAPCSNGSIALMTHMARHTGFPWDCILGADIAQNYKPEPVVYLACCHALRLDPTEVMMIAAHNDDLHAAQAVDLKTGFVLRSAEHGPAQTTDLEPTGDWDITAANLIELAEKI